MCNTPEGLNVRRGGGGGISESGSHPCSKRAGAHNPKYREA